MSAVEDYYVWFIRRLNIFVYTSPYKITLADKLTVNALEGIINRLRLGAYCVPNSKQVITN